MPNYAVETNKIAQLEEPTVATRSYPYTQRMLDQQHDLREAMEKGHWEDTGEVITVPAPVVLAEALDRMHKDYFPEEHN